MLSYEQFITELNAGTLTECHFEILNYSHYKNCRIQRKDDVLNSGKHITLIVVQLTEDETETVSFMNQFNESYKLFRMGHKGAFTLRQVWNRVHFHEIKQK